jgi:hypothetical protein
MSRTQKIHLVSYATPRFRHRQIILGLSARHNRVVNTVKSWNPKMLKETGFATVVHDIGLHERGSGYWAWKPFIIQKRLSEVPEGDIVLYCDVGRFFPYRILNGSINPFLKWMEKHNQDVMPGVLIPWHGTMSVWTKRDVFVFTHTDTPEYHQKVPIEASFSIWKSSDKSRRLVNEWMHLCSQRNLISDDPCTSGLKNLSDFKENRHDQTLLSICCYQAGVQGISIGNIMPSFDYRTPTGVASILWPEEIMNKNNIVLSILTKTFEFSEKKLRLLIK